MNIEWTQVVAAFGIGSGFGWLFRYIFVRWYENRHLDEEIDRGTKAVSLAQKLFDLHEKACDRNINMFIPLGKRAIQLLPISDEQLEEHERRQLDLMQVGQYWLVSLMWHCINLEQIRGRQLEPDRAIEHAEECFASAYDEMDANALMRDFWDRTTTQLLHSYYGYVSRRTDADIEAVVKAMENWAKAHAEDESDG